jgi:hypothetical protein
MIDDRRSRDEKIVPFKKRPASRRPPRPPADPQSERARVRGNVVALVMAAILILVGWLLVDRLGQTSRTQDCLMSGRTNCKPIDGR